MPPKTPEEAAEFMRQKYARNKPPAKPTAKVKYAAYLATPAWHKKRDLVHKRAKGICEGCGQVRSKEVHHLSYAHVGNEFLFELVALCGGCHDRWHGH